MDLFDRIMELSRYGYFCGQILAILLLETLGDHPEHKSAMGEFTKWFEEEAMINYGGIDCRDITKGDPAKRVELCPGLIADTYQKCMEILSEKGLL